MPLQRLYTGPAGYTMNDYQEDAGRSDSGRGDPLIVAALGLAGEAGEFADAIKKVVAQGHTPDRVALAGEVGDILWYAAKAARALGYTLGEIAEFNTEKLKARYPGGFSTERSLNR